MTPEQKANLLILADIIDQSANGQTDVLENECFITKNGRVLFDMRTWNKRVSAFANQGCGTAACALGTAALHPYFRDKGLTVRINGGISWQGEGNAIAGIQALFGEKAHCLFGAGHAGHDNPRDVAANIRFLAKHNRYPKDFHSSKPRNQWSEQ